MGWDPADTHATNFWEEIADVQVTSDSTSRLNLDCVFTPKKYLWIEYYTIQNSTNNNYNGVPTMVMGTNGTSSTTFEDQLYSGHTYQNDGHDGRTTQREWNIYGSSHPSGTTLQDEQSSMQLFMTNQSGKEKYIVGTGFDMFEPGADAGARAAIKRFYGKTSQTTGQANIIRLRDVDDNQGVYFKTGSRMKVWGSD